MLSRSAVAAMAAMASLALAGCSASDSVTTSVAADASATPAAVHPTAAPASTARVATPAATHKASATHATPARRPVVTNGDVLLAGGVVLPNRTRTPGATNPAVTQATIHRTICRTGYTKTIRPPSSYTTGLKVQQLASGYAFHGDRNTSDYEEDHLISLELGGSPTSAQNLWPEPYTAAEGARVKDRVENELHDLVCSGQLSLRTAQRAIAVNWWSAYQRYGGTGVPHVYAGPYASSTATSGSPSRTGTANASASTGAATAQCRDGSYSYSQHRSGTCSHHGGVDHWINPPPS